MDYKRRLDIPLLDQVKIQAQVLVPVLRAFRAELGEERANRIAWQALADWRRNVARTTAQQYQGSPREKWAAAVADAFPAIGDAVDVQLIKQSDDAVEFDITGCRFARLFRELDEPELGFALLCSFDDTDAEEIGAGEVQFTRTRTIMQGADHCDFRYVLKNAAAQKERA